MLDKKLIWCGLDVAMLMMMAGALAVYIFASLTRGVELLLIFMFVCTDNIFVTFYVDVLKLGFNLTKPTGVVLSFI